MDKKLEKLAKIDCSNKVGQSSRLVISIDIDVQLSLPVKLENLDRKICTKNLRKLAKIVNLAKMIDQAGQKNWKWNRNQKWKIQAEKNFQKNLHKLEKLEKAKKIGKICQFCHTRSCTGTRSAARTGSVA